MRQWKLWMMAAILTCGFLTTSCDEALSVLDNPAQPEKAPATPAQLKKGVWTEYDEALLASGKYTDEQLAAMPAVGMQIDGDKANFFLYTAEGASDPIEGKVSYDNTLGKGTITFPTIKDSPLSGQSVDFSMTTDETMEFELTYEGQKTTATFSWLCENTDTWGLETTNEEWEELMGYYKTIAADWGPDPSIDWGDLDEPLTWDETPKANTRAVAAILKGISTGIEIFSSLFEEDPNEVINGKLDAISEKLDKVLANQQVMTLELNKINGRLIKIAEKIDKNTTLNIFNERNKTYYNPLDVQMVQYFDDAYKLYKDNKSDLSKVSADLGDYGKEWVGKDERFINLTWEYIKYLTTVQHSKYGTGMDKIYDGLTFDKYPWEHMGIGDRKNYRAYDLVMIAKCLFMINLYSTYGGQSNIRQKGLYKIYNSYKKQLYDFSTFEIADPKKFLVCQIPGAHFVMHKELQKYNYKSCVPLKYGKEGAYRPEFHEAGSIKIENPKELKSKLILEDAAKAIFNYYKSAFYPKEEKIWWMKMLVEGTKINDKEMAGGAVYAKKPSGVRNNEVLLMLGSPNAEIYRPAAWSLPRFRPIMTDASNNYYWDVYMGETYSFHEQYDWQRYDDYKEYYAAIVEKRF